MSIGMMGMGPGMSDTGKCGDCGSPGAGKAIASCASPACAACMTAQLAAMDVLDIDTVVIHHLDSDQAASGRGAQPDPYPPRTFNIVWDAFRRD